MAGKRKLPGHSSFGCIALMLSFLASAICQVSTEMRRFCVPANLPYNYELSRDLATRL